MNTRYISDATVKNYAYLIESAPEMIATYAMKWLSESKVTLELIEKYKIQELVEERFLITNDMARRLIGKISDMEVAWQEGKEYYSIRYTPTKSPPPKRARRSMSIDESLSPTVSTHSSFMSLMEEWSGPVRNLNEQILAGAY